MRKSHSLHSKVQEIENRTLKKISKSIQEGRDISYVLGLARNLRYNPYQIEQELKKEIKYLTKDMEREIEQALRDAYDNDVYLYKQGGKKLTNIQALKTVDYYIERTLGEFKHLSRAPGVVYNGVHTPIETAIHRAIDLAILEVESGVSSYTDSINRALREISNHGIRFYNSEDGKRYEIESSVRSSILTTVSQSTGYLSYLNAIEMGQDLMQISAHTGARPSHSYWQGMVVSLSGQRGYLSLGDIGYGEADGFKGVNCRHDWYPYFEGISKPMYIPEEPGPIYWQGRDRSHYECTQIQRRMERQMRQTQRKIITLVGDSRQVEELRLREQLKRYQLFSKKAGLLEQRERINTGGVIINE